MVKSRGIGIIVVLFLAISVIGCGCVSDGPEKAVTSLLHHLDNGEYEEAFDLCVYEESGSFKPFRDFKGTDKYDMAISFIQRSFGSGENFKIEDFQVIKKEKINDDQVMVTVSYQETTSWSNKHLVTHDYKVVKLNGEWMVVL